MRPLELRVRNFRSYTGDHTFDFRDRTLVGIVGPIGSGKSSLLDAIAFALYGRTPRIGSATRTLINQRAGDAGVVLRFVVEGDIWEAARSIRAKGPSKHALYRYDSDDPDTEPVEKLLMEGEVNDRIVELLGLDFAAFERSILLAQGRFAEFLQARPADRDKVLKGVFGHDRVDRMKGLAKERRDQAAHSLDKLAIRLEKSDEVRTRLATGRLELAEALKRKKKLAKASKQIAKLAEAAAAADHAIVTATNRLGFLEEHVGRLPDPQTTTRSIERSAAAEERRIELAASLDEAQKRLASAEGALNAVNEAGEPEQIQQAASFLAAADPQLNAVVATDRRIASFIDSIEEEGDAVTVAATRLAEVEQARDSSLGRAIEAAKIVDEAERALELGRHADMAATLRAELELHGDCPVCEQPVHELPDAVDETHIEELGRVVAAARQTKTDVDQAREVALGALERAKEQLQAARDKKAAVETQLSGARKEAIRVRGDLEETTLRLDKILGRGDPADQLKVRRQKYDAVLAERVEAQRSTDQIRGQHDQAIRDEQEAGKALQDLGVRLAELATRLDVELTIGDDARSLGVAFEQLRQNWKEATAALGRDRQAAEQDLAKTQAEQAELLSKLGIETDFNSTVAVLADRIDRIEESVDRDTRELDQATALYAEKEIAADKVELFGRINTDLTDSRFVRFLLDEERSRLAELGSEHFQRLSGGRYRFHDDKFAIVDLTSADATRRADSLSGGETFLASLGLALALAEMVAGTGGRLDAFFLDEGFGTLDPEHLDLAMEGIERLVADDSKRLVVVVSHVPELRMRLEDLIELERNPLTGDTRVIAG